jgi:hypothetical protein
MDDDIRKQLEDQAKKIDLIYRSVEVTRNYFKWTLIITVAVIVLPLIGMLFMIPALMSMVGQYSGL